MKRIIFCNSIERFKKVLGHDEHKTIRYIVFTYNLGIAKLIDFLENDPVRFISVRNSPPPKNFIKDFQDKFVNFIANLNKQNHSTFWWYLNFTNKSPLTTQLCTKISNFLNIVDLIEYKDSDDFLVVTDDVELLRQFRIYAKNKPIKAVNAIALKVNIKTAFQRFTPLKIFLVFYRAFLHSIYVKLYCKFKFDKKEKYNIVLSFLNEQSFTKDGVYRDAFFGDFVYYLKERNIPFINLLIVVTPFYRQMLKKVYSQSSKIPIVTLEYFLSLFDLARGLSRSLIGYFVPIRLKGDLKINGIDFSFLVKKVIKDDYISTGVCINFQVCYAMRLLAARFRIDRFYYPFENRSFEKLLILVLRRVSPKTRIVGYQHASISLRHANFLLGKDEYKITPLPDIIMTMGEITKDILRDYGNFPKSLIHTGCALRQIPFEGELKKRSKNGTNLLVVLTTSLEEYVKVLRFLEEGFKGNNIYNIWVRPHPLLSLDEAIKIGGMPTFKFHRADRKTLNDSYDWVDMLLYVHSTMSIEGLLRGIPVINLKIGNALDPDPLFNFNEFKWRVDEPKALIPVIEKINSLSEDEFLSRQIKASDYAKKYLYKVTTERLGRFLMC